ncbi:MAG: glycoside hydrolase family 3 C-terminal domain-containing protein [Acholeplasmataceae bacterium]|nr:glycoside hydrolase family 3 C-terminal domain-containing protein [Acholeplasmataceae bacterium]
MKLTVEEKVALLDGLDVWHTKPINGLPSIMMADGPHGLRKQYESKDNLGVMGSIPATCFPTASLTACSFDRNLLSNMGKLLAKEAKANQVNIILGPGINMKRTPLCGRNFEYFSEDPYLAGELAAAFVRAVEDSGVGTSVKHFFANNQEKNRFFIDSIVDERALREIYLKAFERVVKENPATLMASYNKINGRYATEHHYLSKILRKEWGYYGVVLSDWGAVHNRIESLKAGTDLEMPSSMGYRTKQVLEAIHKDEALKIAVNKSADRMVELVRMYKKIEVEPIDHELHHKEAVRIAAESMVLLKNEKMLPLTKEDKVLIVGGFVDDMRYQGGGSSHINPTRVDQIADIYKDYSSNINISKGYSIAHTKHDEELAKEAVSLAKSADKVVFLLGLPESHEAEGFDRTSLDLPSHQLKLLHDILEVNEQVICVAVGGSVMNLSFDIHVKAMLLAYLGGQGSSSAIMDILYGKVNPSGRLAETFIDDIKSCNVSLTDDNNAVYYDESIFIGYRYYQTYNKHVRYPFGYGLSYTTFEYKDISIQEDKEKFIIEMTIQNTGKMKGKEVIQIYIGNNVSTVFKARRELKAFDKIELDVNEEKTIKIDLPKKAFEYYDIYKKRYVLEKGEYEILVSKNAVDEIEAFDFGMDGEEIHHPSLSYQKYAYDTSDFPKIYMTPLPPKNIVKKRPYTLSSTLDDASKTLVGKIVAKMVVKEGMKATKDMSEYLQEVAKKTMMETPIQMLALFSAGKFSFQMAEGLVDIMNLKFRKGLKKMKSKVKENGDE